VVYLATVTLMGIGMTRVMRIGCSYPHDQIAATLRIFNEACVGLICLLVDDYRMMGFVILSQWLALHVNPLRLPL
jgi:hypothetical protein